MSEKEKLMYGAIAALAAAILLALAVLAALLSGTGQQAEEPLATPMPTPAPTPEPPFSIADQSAHPALLLAPEDGVFRPDGFMTRGEMVLALARLTEGLETKETTRRRSVLPAEEHRLAVAGMSGAGLPPEPDGFRPQWPMEWQELRALLEALGKQLKDPAGEAARDCAEDLTGSGYVTRREAALVLETLAGREMLEGERLLLGRCVPADLTTEDADWLAIADAVTQGDPPRPEPGVYRLNGWVYAADENGDPVRNGTVGVWSFGPDGRYTTGSEALDRRLVRALQESGAIGLTGRDALEAVYLYVKNDFEYKVTPADAQPEEDGATGWEFARAARFFQYGGGTCFGYAAAFGLLARCLGEDAKIVSATINEYDAPHSFVVIPEDGTDWIYDVELEDARPERHGDLELFHILNYQIYNYWYTPDW